MVSFTTAQGDRVSFETGDIVAIKWIDAGTDTGWRAHKTKQKERDYTEYTVGIMMSTTKNLVQLCSSWGTIGVNEVMVILKGCILEAKRLGNLFSLYKI